MFANSRLAILFLIFILIGFSPLFAQTPNGNDGQADGKVHDFGFPVLEDKQVTKNLSFSAAEFEDFKSALSRFAETATKDVFTATLDFGWPKLEEEYAKLAGENRDTFREKLRLWEQAPKKTKVETVYMKPDLSSAQLVLKNAEMTVVYLEIGRDRIYHRFSTREKIVDPFVSVYEGGRWYFHVIDKYRFRKAVEARFPEIAEHQAVADVFSDRAQKEIVAEAVDQIVEIVFEFMNGKVGMSHLHIEYLFDSNDTVGGKIFWFEDDRITGMDHPDLEALSSMQRVEKENSYKERILSILGRVRARNRKDGLSVRNVFDLKVYRDGKNESEFRYDLFVEEIGPSTLDKYTQFREKIYYRPDLLINVDNFLRHQVLLVVPDGWEDIRIDMVQESDSKARVEHWYRLKGESDFQTLRVRSSKDVIDAIEHWRARIKGGKRRNRSVRFSTTLEKVYTPYPFKYVWDIENK